MKTSDEIRKEIEILEARLVFLRVQLIEAKKKECPFCASQGGTWWGVCYHA